MEPAHFKNGPQAIGKSCGCSNGHCVFTFARNEHDAPEGRALFKALGPMPGELPMLMDKAYEGDETRQLVLDLGMISTVPSKSNRLDSRQYDRELYKKRNEVGRLFRSLKGFRRIFSIFEKLDVIFLAFIVLVLIVDSIK